MAAVHRVASSDLCERAKREFEVGRTAWPELALEFEVFHEMFVRHANPGEQPREIHAADAYLAWACAYAVDGAVERFERSLSGEMERAAGSVRASPAFVADTLQVLRERLLVRNGCELGKIASYAGRSSLESWLRAVTVRTAISLLRSKAEHCQAFDWEDDSRLADGGPELDHLRARYKGAFEEAVRVAIGKLAPRERMLLRLNLVDGMSIDKLAVLYRVGRSTAARWVSGARETLRERVRTELHATVTLASNELDSIAADIQSQLDLSIFRLLRDSGRSAPDA
jgi:RNA polymerase sigma-70 factor (ECF subfamily)